MHIDPLAKFGEPSLRLVVEEEDDLVELEDRLDDGCPPGPCRSIPITPELRRADELQRAAREAALRAAMTWTPPAGVRKLDPRLIPEDRFRIEREPAFLPSRRHHGRA